MKWVKKYQESVIISFIKNTVICYQTLCHTWPYFQPYALYQSHVNLLTKRFSSDCMWTIYLKHFCIPTLHQFHTFWNQQISIVNCVLHPFMQLNSNVSSIIYDLLFSALFVCIMQPIVLIHWQSAHCICIH